MFWIEPMQPIRRHPEDSIDCGDEGQATVELAIVLPFIVLLVAAMIQCGLLVGDQLAVWNAARCAARAAAISPDSQLAAEKAASDAVTLRPLQVTLTTIDDVISARVVYVNRTDFPIIGLLFPHFTLEANVAMLRETPTP